MTVLVAAAAVDSPQLDIGLLLKSVIEGLFTAAAALWPLLLVIGFGAACKLALQVWRLRRLARSGIREIDGMNGETFEVFLTTLFRRLGYRAEHTGRRGDYGADLILTKNGVRTAVQAKCWGRPVGVAAVQQVGTARGFYECVGALVVSNRPFTRQARNLARANGVELWGRDALVSKLLSVEARSPTVAAPHDNSSEGCATCGVPVSEKVRSYCLAHSSHFGGRIYCFKHQRSARIAVAPSN